MGNEPKKRGDTKVLLLDTPIEFHGRWMKSPVSLGAASFPEVVGTAKLMLEAAWEDLRRSREAQGRSRSALIA
jgi:hypothetical protein